MHAGILKCCNVLLQGARKLALAGPERGRCRIPAYSCPGAGALPGMHKEPGGSNALERAVTPVWRAQGRRQGQQGPAQALERCNCCSIPSRRFRYVLMCSYWRYPTWLLQACCMLTQCADAPSRRHHRHVKRPCFLTAVSQPSKIKKPMLQVVASTVAFRLQTWRSCLQRRS